MLQSQIILLLLKRLWVKYTSSTFFSLGCYPVWVFWNKFPCEMIPRLNSVTKPLWHLNSFMNWLLRSLRKKICTCWARAGFCFLLWTSVMWDFEIMFQCDGLLVFVFCIIFPSCLHIFILGYDQYKNIFCLNQWPLLQTNVAFLICGAQGVFKSRV